MGTKFEKKITASLLTVDQIVDRYAEMTTLVRPMPTQRIAPDPDDDVVIGTAIAAKANFIVTGDRPFLSVSRHLDIEIISVSDAVRKLGEP